MPTVDLNFGMVGAIPDEGIYRAECKKAVYKLNKTGDGHIINMQMTLIDMEDDRFENFAVFDNPSLKVTARWRLKEMLEAFTGEPWTEDNMEIEVDDDNRVPLLEESTCLVLVEHNEYNN